MHACVSVKLKCVFLSIRRPRRRAKPVDVSSNALLAAVRFDVILPATNDRSMPPPAAKRGPDETRRPTDDN